MGPRPRRGGPNSIGDEDTLGHGATVGPPGDVRWHQVTPPGHPALSPQWVPRSVRGQGHLWGGQWPSGRVGDSWGGLGTVGDGHLEQGVAAGAAQGLGQAEAEVTFLLAVTHQEGTRHQDTATAGALGTRGGTRGGTPDPTDPPDHPPTTPKRPPPLSPKASTSPRIPLPVPKVPPCPQGPPLSPKAPSLSPRTTVSPNTPLPCPAQPSCPQGPHPLSPKTPPLSPNTPLSPKTPSPVPKDPFLVPKQPLSPRPPPLSPRTLYFVPKVVHVSKGPIPCPQGRCPLPPMSPMSPKTTIPRPQGPPCPQGHPPMSLRTPHVPKEQSCPQRPHPCPMSPRDLMTPRTLCVSPRTPMSPRNLSLSPETPCPVPKDPRDPKILLPVPQNSLPVPKVPLPCPPPPWDLVEPLRGDDGDAAGHRAEELDSASDAVGHQVGAVEDGGGHGPPQCPQGHLHLWGGHHPREQHLRT